DEQHRASTQLLRSHLAAYAPGEGGSDHVERRRHHGRDHALLDEEAHAEAETEEEGEARPPKLLGPEEEVSSERASRESGEVDHESARQPEHDGVEEQQGRGEDTRIATGAIDSPAESEHGEGKQYHKGQVHEGHPLYGERPEEEQPAREKRKGRRIDARVNADDPSECAQESRE